MITSLYCCDEYLDKLKKLYSTETKLESGSVIASSIPVIKCNTMFPLESKLEDGTKVKIFGMMVYDDQKPKVIVEKI